MAGSSNPVQQTIEALAKERGIDPQVVIAAIEDAVLTASRKVFLDNEDEPAAIRRQLQRLIDLARRRGEAVAIGHAHRQTAQVLREMLDEFDAASVELVPISILAR